MLDNHLWTMEPVGREENTIQGKKYRFTLLTSRLIRMEYREDGKFEDRPTQSVWNRRFEPVAHRLVTEEEGFELFTDHMHVVYSGKKKYWIAKDTTVDDIIRVSKTKSQHIQM